MKTQNLLEKLQKRGIELKVDDDNLRYRAPKGALTDDLRQAMKVHKAKILVLLQGDEPKAATTDWRESGMTKRMPPDEQVKLECLLDELLGKWWREASDEEFLQTADEHHRKWQANQDKAARIIASAIWELTGNPERMKELGFVVPWWYQRDDAKA